MIEEKIDALIEALNKNTAALTQATTATPAGSTDTSEKSEAPATGTKDLKTLKKEAIKLGIAREDVINIRKVENVQAMIDDFLAKKDSAGTDDLDLDDADAGDDEDDGLGLDDLDDPEETLTLKEVKAKLGEVAQEKNKETVLKIFKKFGYANANDIPEDKYREVYDVAVKVLSR